MGTIKAMPDGQCTSYPFRRVNARDDAAVSLIKSFRYGVPNVDGSGHIFALESRNQHNTAAPTLQHTSLNVEPISDLTPSLDFPLSVLFMQR